ncbi:hypothetical protein GBA52_008467 [Prunus armeniaca]|nr:hypothetical protein GBA52_008467 [Prunus armeniaca]
MNLHELCHVSASTKKHDKRDQLSKKSIFGFCGPCTSTDSQENPTLTHSLILGGSGCHI